MGIRELRQHASTWVHRAAAGETIEVTDRGRPVARMGPIPAEPAGFATLEAAGLIRPAKGELTDHERSPIKAGSPTLSEALAELRADER